MNKWIETIEQSVYKLDEYYNKKIDNINREIFNYFKSLKKKIDLIAITDETIYN